MKEIFGDDRGLKDGDLTQAPWAQGDFDDSKWQKMSQPIHWNQAPELKEVDGIVWLRRVIDIPTPLAPIGTARWWARQRVGTFPATIRFLHICSNPDATFSP